MPPASAPSPSGARRSPCWARRWGGNVQCDMKACSGNRRRGDLPMVTVRKPLSWVLTSVTLTLDLWPWPFAWTSLLSLVITPENFMMIWWWEHSQKGVTDRQDGQTDRQTDWTIHRAAWSQLKTIGHLFYATLSFVHHFITIGEFKLELGVRKRQIWVKIDDFFSYVTLQLDVWPWKTIGHLFYATSSFVHHFIATGEFKHELQSGNAHSGSNSKIFWAVWPWNMTDDLEKQ